MTGRDVARVDLVGAVHEVAELGEGVAAHARNRRAAARVFVHEVVDHVVAERALEIQHVVRDAELLAHAPRVVDRVERAARTVGDVLAIAEELHRRADDVVALLDEQRCRDGRVHAAGHRDENALLHTAAIDRALATSFAKTSITRSTDDSSLIEPKLMRIAAPTRSWRTPIAESTCDGLALPL